jgi:hypothetical protein
LGFIDGIIIRVRVFFFIKKRDLSVDFIEIGVDLHLVDNKAFLGCANIYASLLLAKKLHYI